MEHGHAEADHSHDAPAHPSAAHSNDHAAPTHAPAAHGNGHAAPAHTPSHAPNAPTTTAHASTAAHAPATGERPIVAGYRRVKAGLTSSASQVVATTSAFGQWLKKVFRAGELEPIEQVSIPKTLPYTAGHIIDGTVLGAPRTAIELGEPTAAATLATVRTLAIPFSPLHNLAHPIEALKNPSRIVTSIAMGVKNAAMAIPRRIHEFADRSVARSIEQISTQLRRIPLIGSLIATPATWISRKVADIVGAVKNGVDWITSPVDHIHNATAPGEAAPAAPAPAHAH